MESIIHAIVSFLFTPVGLVLLLIGVCASCQPKR